MKNLAVVFFAAALILGWNISIACAGMYVSGNIAGVRLEDSDISGGYQSYDELSFDTGFGLGVAFGYAANNGFRVEGEIAARYNEMDELSNDVGHEHVDEGYVSAFSVMANAFYNFLPESEFSPFIGAGAGVVAITADFDYDEDDDDDDDDWDDWDDDDEESDSDAAFAYQLAAGVSFDISEQIKADLQYRYFKADEPDFDDFELEYTAQSVMLGLRYNF